MIVSCHQESVTLKAWKDFDPVIVTQAPSRLIIIEEIHNASEEGGGGQSATQTKSDSAGGDKPESDSEVRPR